MLATIVLIMLLAWLACTALMAVRVSADAARTDAGESLARHKVVGSNGQPESSEG